MGSFKMFSVESTWGTIFLLILTLLHITAVPIEIPRDPQNAGLPSYHPYQPEPPEKIQVREGERRCDNFYHGHIPPCLLRPWLPPFSYSTTEGNNGEYRKKRNANSHRFHAVH